LTCIRLPHDRTQRLPQEPLGILRLAGCLEEKAAILAKRWVRDHFRETQKRCLAAPLDMGVPLESLLMVEWLLAGG
jgi:hypothetical protein